jgi:hypothetical protein
LRRDRLLLFYTDDIGLFSTRRRLSRDGDPTQPAIDLKLTVQGSGMAFEPLLTVTQSLTISGRYLERPALVL